MSMTRNVRLLFGTVSAIGFVAALLVHLAALRGVDVAARIPGVWLLHLGVFALFVPLVLMLRQSAGPRTSLLRIARRLPLPAAILGVVMLAYAIANFMLFIQATEGGSPAMQDGTYFLMDHARVVREITSAEYTAFRANEVRGFSGHWLFFYYVSTIFGFFWKSETSSSS